ncbi:AraC family transcriptional regulator [Dyadobacter luticola]|uniref:AraC family transcriptional regulator n=1 Tax=Dyadobacter luticola TaxID=1979387 RepID=A0A5R9L469_9BACT|nr:AraC family transcriptional regulator [Dyadobacter luticola]TLV03382.1 AraC family transcriptional regulator [Dyadobacter luticola]
MSVKKSRGFEGELIIEIPKVAATHCEALPLISSLYLSRIGFYPKALYHYYQRPAGISQAIFLYCTDGKGWITIRGETFTVQAGEVFIIPTDIPHSYGADAKNPWSIYWLHLVGKNANDAALTIMEAENGMLRPVQVGLSEERNVLFKRICTTLLKGYSASNLLFANLTLAYYLSTFIASEQFNRQNALPAQENAVDRSIRYMQENLSTAITLDNIAQSAHLSVSFFSRKFKQETGYAPIEYFNHLRIQKACQLLHFSELRINEVASQIGIDDPFYFSRLFKQQMGISPVLYRKNRGAETGI